MKSTRKQALRIAQRLGCYGAHQAPDGSWLPCSDEETFIAVSRGEEPPARKGEKISLIEIKTARNASISKSLYPTREQALAASRRNGCAKVRVVKINGGTMYAACMPKNNGRPENTGMIKPSKNDWEPLNEGPIASIDTLPDGSLVSGKNLGRSISRNARSVKPSTVDGDNDGFLTGIDGRDNIPAPPKPNDRVMRITVDYERQFMGLSKPEIEKATQEAEKHRLEVIARRKREREKEKNQSKKDLDITEIDAKGFVNYVSRSTDPDVFLNADSARVRARQLGCIGIRSYTASDGKTVYLPCTATPDYNRVMNIRPDGRPKKQKKKDDCGCEEKSLAKTPAPKKDRVIGSRKNRIGSAGSVGSAGSIDMDEAIVRTLSSKVREHNASVKKNDKNDWSKTNLRALKAVYRRGAGAFSVSHRPGMTRNQWAMGRVNAFLRLLMSGSAKASYVTDNDLLPKGHPWKKRGLGSKSLFIDGDEYFAEPIDQVVDAKGKKTRYVIISLEDDSQEKLQ